MEGNEEVIRAFYKAFNERRLTEASRLFHDDAVQHDVTLACERRGGEGYLSFTAGWLTAFPDATLNIERITPRDGNVYEVDLTAHGTHLGALDMGGCGIFKPTGARATLNLRQLLELRDGRIAYSSVSFDFQEIIRQLVTVDFPRLEDHLQKIQQIAARLSATPAESLVERRLLVERLGHELDAARRVVRPYFIR